jgi:hypothetical protein
VILRKSLCLLGIFTGILSSPWTTVSAAPLQQPVQEPMSLQFPQTSDRGAPARTTGGGSRGSSCVAEGETPLVALMPTRNNVGTTVTAHPTLFWYIPQSRAQLAEFVLINSLGEEVYLATVTLAGTPGILKLDLPETVALEIGQDYLWQFAIICDSQDRESDVFVRGLLQRRELSRNLQNQLKSATGLEQAQIYANAEIWHDSLAMIAELRSSEPVEWEELLNSIGLLDIATSPFLEVPVGEKLSDL